MHGQSADNEYLMPRPNNKYDRRRPAVPAGNEARAASSKRASERESTDAVGVLE